jgi:hypothetical protein
MTDGLVTGTEAPIADPLAGADRTELWLPLLRRLTEVSPKWLVWKNADAALAGIGDIDAAAPDDDWPAIEETFASWALEHDVGPVVVCRHIPGGLNLIAVPAGQATFLEMGVKQRRIWRGATLFQLEDLLPMAELDERGFRRLRPGAEGFLKLLLNGTRRDGRPNEAALAAKGVRQQLLADPPGVHAAAALFGPGRRVAERAGRRAARGGWDRPAMLAVQGLALLRAASQPGILLSRLRFRIRTRHTCPLVRAILFGGRRIPADREAWLRELAEDHAVLARRPASRRSKSRSGRGPKQP